MAGPRSLGSYLTMARPADFWGKATVAPLIYGTIHALGDPHGGVAVGAAVVAWLVFELGLYEVRYELNDLADASVDQMHVAAAGRGRVPADPRTRRWTMRVIALRLALSAVVIVLLPDEARRIVLVVALGLAGVTAGYEGARTVIRRRHLDDWREARLGPAELAVFVLVGGGYALRTGLGAALAGASGDVLVAMVALGWTLGVLAILMNWTGDAAILRIAGDDEVLARKSHIAVLARRLDSGPGDLERPLLRGDPARITSLLLSVTSVVAVWFAASLSRWPPPGRLAVLLAVVAVAPTLLTRWPSVWAGVAVIAVDSVAAVALAAAGGRGQMVAVLFYVVALPALARAIKITAFGPGRVLVDRSPDPQPALS